MDEDFILTGFVLKEPSNIVRDTIHLYVNDELITDNLYRDAYEGYTKCVETPLDANEENTFITDELLEKFKKGYKYILFENEYYFWHQIHFNDGDEICIKTDRINRYINTSGFIISGYNRFINYPVNPEIPEASIDNKKEIHETYYLGVN
jgi:hypothetical protein